MYDISDFFKSNFSSNISDYLKKHCLYFKTNSITSRMRKAIHEYFQKLNVNWIELNSIGTTVFPRK
jgi:hypothetical protein